MIGFGDAAFIGDGAVESLYILSIWLETPQMFPPHVRSMSKVL